MYGTPTGTLDVTTASTSGYLIQHTRDPGNRVVNKGVRIFHIHLVSGATASNLLIADGSGGTTRINITGTASKGIDFDFGFHGIVFPKGAYYTTDANIVEAAITCMGDDL